MTNNLKNESQPIGTGSLAMSESFMVLRDSISKLNRVLDELQSGHGALAPQVQNFKEGVFCLELALIFYEEANRAVQAGAWFAAVPVASSALESMLLYKCFMEEANVKSIPKFQTFKQSLKADYGLFARSMDLGKLLEIANQLSWFPKGGVPQSFMRIISPHLDQAASSELLKIFDGVENVGQTCANHVREYRNLLHPAVCLKGLNQPSREAGMAATLLFMVAFTSLTVR